MLTEFLTDNLKISKTNSDLMKIGGGRGGTWWEPRDICGVHPLESKFWQQTLLTNHDLKQYIRNTPWPQLAQEIQAGVAAAQEKHVHEVGNEDEPTPEEQAMLQPFVVAQNVTNAVIFLWDKNLRCESDWSPNVLKTKLRSNIWYLTLKNVALARIVFDPYNMEPTWQTVENNLPVTICNKYRPPIWQTENLREQETETYPEIFTAILNHLFPLPNEREIVLDWLCLALFARPVSFLSLRGARGNGKTIFKQIVYHLIGNFVEAQDDVLSKFTAYIRHKRIIGVDDKDVMGSQKGNSFRKHILNPMLTYEEKFEKVGGSESNYISLLICSNPGNAMYVEWDERRIVSPTMGTVKMESWCNQDVFNWLGGFEQEDASVLSDGHVAWLKMIGEALWTRWNRKKILPNLQLKSGYFWLDVVRSLSAFKKCLCEELLGDIDNPVIDYEEVKASFKLMNRGGIVAHWGTVKAWLLMDFELWGVKLATEADDENKTLTVNPAFREMVIKQRRGNNGR